MIILGLILFALPCSFRIQGYFRNLKYQKTLTKIYSWFIHQLSSFDFIVVWVLYVHVLQQGIKCQVFVPLSLLLLLLLFPKRLKWKKKLKKYNPSNIDKYCRFLWVALQVSKPFFLYCTRYFDYLSKKL